MVAEAISTRILATTARRCDAEINTPCSAARRSRIGFAVALLGRSVAVRDQHLTAPGVPRTRQRRRPDAQRVIAPDKPALLVQLNPRQRSPLTSKTEARQRQQGQVGPTQTSDLSLGPLRHPRHPQSPAPRADRWSWTGSVIDARTPIIQPRAEDVEVRRKSLAIGGLAFSGLSAFLVAGAIGSEAAVLQEPGPDHRATLIASQENPGRTVYIKELPDGSRVPVTEDELARISDLKAMYSGDESFAVTVTQLSEVENAPTVAVTHENLLTLVGYDADESEGSEAIFFAPLDSSGRVPFCDAFLVNPTEEVVLSPQPSSMADLIIGDLKHVAGGEAAGRRAGCARIESDVPYGLVVISPPGAADTQIEEVFGNVDVAS